MHLAPSVKQQSQPDGGAKMAVDPNELYNQLMRQNAAEHDIQAIAKQISDHAEAIYQTWKSKGLTANELLHLHSTEAPPSPSARVPATATPPSVASPVATTAPSAAPRSAQRPLSTVELLANPQLEATLEQLVNSFVQEDKARVAARSRTSSPSATAAAASTIQAALKRFESRGVSPSRPLDGDTSVKLRAAQFANRMERSTSPTPWMKRPEPKTVVTEVTHQVAAAAPAQVKSEIEKEEEKLINALKTGQVIEVPGSSEHFLMAKKIRERLQQQRRSVPSGNAEKELDTLVDRLKTMEPRREGSPAVLSLREGLPSRSTSPRSVKLSETVPISGVSTVDYAKVRYQAAQANPLTQQRLEDVKNFSKTPQPNLVSETRTRFEGPTLLLNTRVTNNVPVPWRSPTPPETDTVEQTPPLAQPVAGSESNMEALRRLKNRKLRKSPEPPSQPNMASIPHPELTQQQKQHLRERSLQQMAPTTNTPIRPFLTRGSVAERVLLFEKCPAAVANEGVGFYHHAKATERTTPSGAARSATATVTKTATATTVIAAEKPFKLPEVKKVVKEEIKIREPEQKQQAPSEVVRVAQQQRPAKATTSVQQNLPLPRFYFPTGRPIGKEQVDGCLHRLVAAFQQLPGQRANREHFGLLAKACGCPLYWKSVLYIASGGESSGHVTHDSFLEFWKKIISNYHDEASRFVRLLTMINPNTSTSNNNSNGVMVTNATHHGRTFLVPEDFVPLIQDVVDTHPGLTFLKEAAEFHSRYVHTVIARIFYNVNRSWSGQISLAELRHSNLLATIRLLEEEEDINQITDYFSYEHFYVIYCKFWELDKDHDLFIDKKDLARHNDHALSSKIIDRIFSGAVTRGVSKLTGGNKTPNNTQQPRMSYTEFVWFLISEEDKRHATAIEYWFRCMDLDGDGYLSMYELEYFYEEQLQRMESLGIETLPFEDCLCQMLDMIHPAVPGKISLNDLKRCQMTPIFFDTFFNLEKYLDHEQRDPFASQRDPDSENGDETHKLSDWDRYAAEEYELLVAEEGGPDQNDDMYMRDDVATPDADSERDVIMSEDGADYSHLRPLFSVTPCAVEYHY